jgi:hypothetical protein
MRLSAIGATICDSHTRYMNDYLPVAAVLRLDAGWREVLDDEVQNAITVVAVVPTIAEADAEVARLNALNGAHARYVWAYTRWYPDGRTQTGV